MLSIIVAASVNKVIGKDGGLPWCLPGDLAHFKKLTRGHMVIMGRKTYESLPARSRPLPDRKNVVISRSWQQPPDQGVIVISSIEEALALVPAKEEAFVIGGSEIYSLALPFVSKIYLTKVQAVIRGGDSFFPNVDEKWRCLEFSGITQGDADEFPYRFLVYERL